MANFRIPNSQGQTRTIYKTDKYGELWDTFGIDLQSIGKIKSAKKMLKVKDVSDDGNFGDVYGLATYNNHHYVVTGSGTGKEIYRCGVADDVRIENNWDKQNSNGSFGAETDTTVFGGNLLISQATNIMNTDGSTYDEDWWTAVISGTALTSSRPHTMEVLRGGQETLFVLDGNKVRYYNATAGHSTVTLQTDLVASVLDKGRDSMYVGTYTETNENALVYEIYVGEVIGSTPVARFAFPVDGRAVLALRVVDGIPYVITDKGHIQKFNGAGFVTVNSLPFAFTDEQLQGVRAGSVSNNSANKPIHHGGTDVHNQSIFFAMNTEMSNQDKTPNRCASGIWEYNTVTNQLNHRSAFVETSTQNGGHLGEATGPLIVINNSESLFLAGFELNGQSNGLFAESDSFFGYIITTEIESNSIQQAFNTVIVKADTILDDATIDVKYRTVGRERQTASGAWLNARTFNTTATVTVEEGDEITILDGTHTGAIAHVQSVSRSVAVTSIVLTEDVATTGDAVVIEITNFQLLAKNFSSADKEFLNTGTDVVNTWVQFKLVFNGKISLREFIAHDSAKTSAG